MIKFYWRFAELECCGDGRKKLPIWMGRYYCLCGIPEGSLGFVELSIALTAKSRENHNSFNVPGYSS